MAIPNTPTSAFAAYTDPDAITELVLPKQLLSSKYGKHIDQMNLVQNKVFKILMNLYYGHFAKSATPVLDPKSQLERFQWTEETWIINCIKAVYELSNEPADFPNDCWFSCDSPIKADPMEFTTKHTQGSRYFKVYNPDADSRNKSVELHILAAALMFPKEALELDRVLQVRHRCVLHSQQLCWSPWHLRLGSDLDNKSDMGCRFGSAFWCPHEPVCLWCDANGKPIPCRNLVSSIIPGCNCTINCKLLKGRNEECDPAIPINVHGASKKQKK